MQPSRIFISFAGVDDPQGREMADRLIADLRASGVEIITASEDLSTPALVTFLARELASCQYLILIQTPTALQSLHVQTTLQIALTLLKQQYILRFIALSSEPEGAQTFSWETLRAFDASQDYPRMREKLLLELGLTSLDTAAETLFPEEWPPFDLLKTSAAGPLPLEECPTSGWPPSLEQILDRPAPARNRLAFFPFKGLRTPLARQLRQLDDRPAPLLRRYSFLQWKTLLSFFLALALIVAAGFLFFGKAAFSQLARTPAHSAVVSPSHPASAFLAQDTFQRPDQAGWGIASDGQPWGADAVNRAIFSIQQQGGVIAGGRKAFDATLGPKITDAEIFFTGSINFFENKNENFGALLRWVNTNTFYKAEFEGAHLVLSKHDHTQMTRLASVPFVTKARTLYNLRFRVQGTTLSARAWPVGSPEPTQWMITARDTTIHSGLGGLRTFAVPGTIITITEFQESLI